MTTPAAARRKAFVADGSATNWGVRKKHFSHYTLVLDFTHAVCYLYAAALAGRSAQPGWRDDCQWAPWVWAGQTAELIAAVESRLHELRPPRRRPPQPNHGLRPLLETKTKPPAVNLVQPNGRLKTTNRRLQPLKIGVRRMRSRGCQREKASGANLCAAPFRQFIPATLVREI